MWRFDKKLSIEFLSFFLLNAIGLIINWLAIWRSSASNIPMPKFRKACKFAQVLRRFPSIAQDIISRGFYKSIHLIVETKVDIFCCIRIHLQMFDRQWSIQCNLFTFFPARRHSVWEHVDYKFPWQQSLWDFPISTSYCFVLNNASVILALHINPTEWN